MPSLSVINQSRKRGDVDWWRQERHRPGTALIDWLLPIMRKVYYECLFTFLSCGGVTLHCTNLCPLFFKWSVFPDKHMNRNLMLLKSTLWRSPWVIIFIVFKDKAGIMMHYLEITCYCFLSTCSKCLSWDSNSDISFS